MDRAELLSQKAPVDRPRQLSQRVAQVGNLTEPCLEQIALSVIAPLPRPHRSTPPSSRWKKRITPASAYRPLQAFIKTIRLARRLATRRSAHRRGYDRC